MRVTFCIFGDSIIWGAGLPRRVSWANLLRNYLEKRQSGIIELYDLGIDRDTTEDLLERFDAEAKARNPNEIIFAVGINDSSYRENKNNHIVSVDKFESNLLKLIQKSGKFTRNIMFVGLAKGSDKETVPLRRSTTGKCYDKESAEIYNNIIEDVCKRENIPFINILNKLKDEDFYDGLHPSIGGHRKIFNAVKKFLIKNKTV